MISYLIILITFIAFIAIVCTPLIYTKCKEAADFKRAQEIYNLEEQVAQAINIDSDKFRHHTADHSLSVKSRQTLANCDMYKFYRDDPSSLNYLDPQSIFQKDWKKLQNKAGLANKIDQFLASNEFKDEKYYEVVASKLSFFKYYCSFIQIKVSAVSNAGNILDTKWILVTNKDFEYMYNHPETIMNKTDLKNFQKEQESKQLLSQYNQYCDKINNNIDMLSEIYQNTTNKEDKHAIELVLNSLYSEPLKLLNKIKTSTSPEWKVLDDLIVNLVKPVDSVISKYQKIKAYYASQDFLDLKDSCSNLMTQQKDFNDYIVQKVNSLTELFGTRICREETETVSERKTIKKFNKVLTPFTAEVSATVFSSAENSPIDYVIKYFYPNKAVYPEQIQKLQQLLEEIATLREAKTILDSYKTVYNDKIADVPEIILTEDEDNFYKKLGLNLITEESLTVEYRFVYTSDGGSIQRSFTVPMTEENINIIISNLQSKLTMSSFSKEQRRLMTSKLRQFIKERDSHTCQCCGNSVAKEPNLLLEVDHIIPVAKGGTTVEDNLQTLCWRCNRSKSDKIINN